MHKPRGQLRLIWAGIAWIVLTIAHVAPVGAHSVPVASSIEGGSDPSNSLRVCRGWERVASPTTSG